MHISMCNLNHTIASVHAYLVYLNGVKVHKLLRAHCTDSVHAMLVKYLGAPFNTAYTCILGIISLVPTFNCQS